MAEGKEHRGLSPSSMGLFLSCSRKYWHSKVNRTPIDSDASTDTEPFSVGKAFHKCLEDCKHDLKGYTFKDTVVVVSSYGLDPDRFAPLIFAMLGQYKKVHEKAGLKAIACEVMVATDSFYGFVDVILQDKDGGFFIGDMKTAGSYSPLMVPTLLKHPQINLYAAHYKEIAFKLGLDPEMYRGCRYRMTTKSKLIQKKGEGLEAYIQRMGEGIKSYDFIMPKEQMDPSNIVAIHAHTKEFIDEFGTEEVYGQNYGTCLQYFKPCEYFSKCHGRNFTEMNLEVVTND